MGDIELHNARGIQIDHVGHCQNCAAQWSGDNCVRAAKKHALKDKHTVEWSIGYLFDGNKEPKS